MDEIPFLSVLYPYLLKVGNDYIFRLPYRIITDESNRETKDGPNGIDFSVFQDNALFFMHHFYEDDIPIDYIETISVLDFFYLLDDAIEESLESSGDFNSWN